MNTDTRITVTETTTLEQRRDAIKTAIRRGLKRYHADYNGDPNAESLARSLVVWLASVDYWYGKLRRSK